MEVELTSERDDGSFTWRAAGARQPRGVVEEKLLPPGARVGDVLRVETELGLDGITVVSVLPTKEKLAPEGLIELAPRPATSGVTTSLVGHAGRPGTGRSRRDGLAWAGGEREGASRSGARLQGHADGRRSRPGIAHDGADRANASRTEGVEARREGRDRRPPGVARGDRPFARARGGTPPHGESRPARPGFKALRDMAGRDGGDAAAGVEVASRERPGGRGAGPARLKGKPRTQRLVPGTDHRDALVGGLPVEQRPVAEQLTAGGMPAVRRALEEARAQAQAQGLPAASGDGVIALAVQLQPRVREALWLDRAEAVAARLDGIALRDLRTTVLGAAPRDEEGRALLRRLRQSLEERTSRLRVAWERDMGQALEAGRVLQALRRSARPPEPTARFPASLVTRLAESAGSAMTETTPVERWLALLEAVVASPVRRSVKPLGLPEDPSGALRHAAQQVAGRVPSLAPLLGMSMPPPPRPLPPPRVPSSVGVRNGGVTPAPISASSPPPATTPSPAAEAPPRADEEGSVAGAEGGLADPAAEG